jgi:hypothetical protein
LATEQRGGRYAHRDEGLNGFVLEGWVTIAQRFNAGAVTK